MTIWRSETVEEAVIRTNNRASGFDYMRFYLAAAVVLWHAFRTSYYGFDMDGWYRPVVGLVLPMFFALSGFLISGSLTRVRTIREFMLFRAVRILPALVVEVCLSVLIIGVLFTTLDLGDYFSSHRTHNYFKNIYGDIHFRLPGVFEGLPKEIVNASLWTIPYELECYLVIIALWVLRIIRSAKFLLLAVVAVQLMVPVLDILAHDVRPLSKAVSGRTLVVSFLWGVVIYFFRSHIRLSLPLFLAATGTAMLLLMNEYTSYLVCAPAAYVTVYLGLLNPKRVGIIFKGDYSYGIYLYSYPAQQMIASLMGDQRSWYVSFIGAMLLSGLCAAFSWHIIEKPILKHRKTMANFVNNPFRRPAQAPT